MRQTPAITPDQFLTFGELLKYLRRRAGLTQRELSIAVGYSLSQISRLEQNERLPDTAAIAARFVPALDLQREPEWVARLLELARTSHVPNKIESGKAVRQLASPQLPVQLTSFIGREQHLAELKQLLIDQDRQGLRRLVTLTGAGGSGKTRLALRVGTDLEIARIFQDGVWWIELSPLQSPEFVLQTVARALDVPEVPNQTHLETLTNYLRPRHLLLVLDNCEHLIAACAELATALLTQCPVLRILATSREVLGIPPEQVLQVPPLSLPQAQAPATFREIAESDAIRLFVERARASNREFSLTDLNAHAVLHICSQLDGIPLAIELAATRIKVMSVEQITARLKDRFRLLTTGSRVALPRHQTLRATIDWSYELLTEREKILFRRLSIFVGGWTLEAAEAVCSGRELEPSQVLDLLTRLVDKSLVTQQVHFGAARYYFLETIRSYSQEKLSDSEERRQLLERHLDYFLSLAEETNTETSDWSYRPSALPNSLEADNFRAGLEWSLGGADIERGVRFVASLIWFWGISRYRNEAVEWLNEGVEWLDRALSVSSQASPSTRAYTFLSASYLNQDRGNLKAAVTLGETSLLLHRELGDERRLADAVSALGRALFIQGNYERAVPLLEEGIGMFKKLGYELGAAECLRELAVVRQRQGDYEGSVPLLEECLRLASKNEDEQAIQGALGVLAKVHLLRGDYVQATALYARAMEIRLRNYDSSMFPWSLEFYAVLATLQKQPERAARLWGAALALRESLFLPRPPAQSDYDAYEQDARSQLDSETFAGLFAEGRAMPWENAIEYAMQVAE